ncbi:MAG: DUF2007 domain-containing protein [Eubacterium sp.]|nr:DUF2007 domain-containing protein [Eubacterium sp.]
MTKIFTAENVYEVNQMEDILSQHSIPFEVCEGSFMERPAKTWKTIYEILVDEAHEDKAIELVERKPEFISRWYHSINRIFRP